MARMPDSLEVTMPDGTVQHIGIRAVTSPVHECPAGTSGVMPCCGRTPFEVPPTDRMAVDPVLVTCAPARAEARTDTTGEPQ